MEITIKQTREFSSRVIWAPVFKPEDILSPDKSYFAVVDSSAQWFFERHLSTWVKAEPFIVQDVNESMKTLATVETILNFLLESRAERSSVLIAVGGGVLLDMAGLCASLCKRGMPWIAIPTTLLSQVDASIGGKTAVNAGVGKNVFGQFWPPAIVSITPEVGETWNHGHRLEGIAEMYKIFSVFDLHSARALLRPFANSLLLKSIELKAEVVSVDPWENNLRAALNYGHTFGHAIEHSTGLRHGLAVALGIRCENRVAEDIGIMSADTRKRMDLELDWLGFTVPNSLPAFSHLLDYLRQDKKNVAGKIRLSMIDGLKELPMSEFDPTASVEENILERSYKSFCADWEITVGSPSG